MKTTILALAYSMCAWAMDQSIDFAGSFIGHQTNRHHNVQYEHRVWVPNDPFINFAFFKARASVGGDLDLAVGLGVRRLVGGSYVGVYFVQDYSYLYKTHNFQVGPGLEYSNRSWSFYLNCYCPATPIRRAHNKKIIPLVYSDAGVVWKNLFYSVGLHPSFDVTGRGVGLVLRTEVPTKYGLFYFDTGKSGMYQDHARIGFNFYLIGKRDLYHEPGYRQHGLIYKAIGPKKPQPVSLLPFCLHTSQTN